MQHNKYPKYRPDIDGLRAVAILSVVIFHAFPSLLPGGFIGVDVFFVISGYLISSILLLSLEESKFSFADFYFRRIRRIFPALIIVLLFVFAFGYYFLFSEEYRSLAEQVGAGSTFVANFLFWLQTGYFDLQAKYKPLLNLWTLGIEEQFYIVWPLFIFFVYKCRIKLLPTIIVLYVLSFSVNIYYSETHLVDAFYLPQSRFFELLTGCILAVVKVHDSVRFISSKKLLYSRFLGEVGSVISILGACMLIVGFVFLNKSSIFPGWRALFPTVGTLLLICGGRDAWLNKKILANPILLFVGLISYPLYLWHWPLLSFLSILFPGNSILSRIVVLVLSFLLATATYYFIEKRFKTTKRLKRNAIVLSIIMGIVFLISLYIYLNNGLPKRFNRELQSLQHETASWRNLLIRNPICQSKFNFRKDLQFCNIAKINKKPTVAIIGDSHANAYYQGLKHYYLVRNENLINLGDESCPAVMGIKAVEKPGLRRNCMGVDDSFRYVIKNQDIKIVILSSRWQIYTDNSNKYWHLVFANENKKYPKIKNFYQALNYTVLQLINSGKKVIILFDVPGLSLNINNCIRPLLGSSIACRRPLKKVKAVQENSRRSLFSIIKKYQTIEYFDPLPFFCGKKFCYALKNGVPLYRQDGTHLSLYGSSYIATKYHPV